MKAVGGAVLSSVEGGASEMQGVFLVDRRVGIKIGREARIVSRDTAAFVVRGIVLVTLVVMAARMAGEVVMLVVTLRLRLGRMIASSSDLVSELVDAANRFLALSRACGLSISWKRSSGVANWPPYSSYPRKW